MTATLDGWTIEFHSGIPAYRQIINHVEAGISQGWLRAGDQLPSIRVLHSKLKVNPNTVVKAYRELEHSRLITTSQGTGCFISAAIPEQKLSAHGKEDKLNALAARFVAEAKSHGITFAELLKHLEKIQSYE